MAPKLALPGGLVRAEDKADGADAAKLVFGALAVCGGTLLFRRVQQVRPRLRSCLHKAGSLVLKVVLQPNCFRSYRCLQRKKRYFDLEQALRTANAFSDALQEDKVSFVLYQLW